MIFFLVGGLEGVFEGVGSMLSLWEKVVDDDLCGVEWLIFSDVVVLVVFFVVNGFDIWWVVLDVGGCCFLCGDGIGDIIEDDYVFFVVDEMFFVGWGDFVWWWGVWGDGVWFVRWVDLWGVYGC